MRLFYFSPVPWASFAQRPHAFVRCFHDRHGAGVTWFDPYPTRLPAKADWMRVFGQSNYRIAKARQDGVIPHWLKLVRMPSLPIEPLPPLHLLNRWLWRLAYRFLEPDMPLDDARIAIGKPSLLALDFLDRNPGIPALYDAMDDFPAFYGGLSKRSMALCEAGIVSRAARISVSSTQLATRFSASSNKLVIARNACDIPSFPSLSEARDRAMARKVIGYVGTMGEWFDWALVAALAHAMPDGIVRLIGPVYTCPGRALPRNVEILSPRGHAQAMAAMQDFTVGIIPFKLTELTASVDPIKYYEYRAFGLPVISTRFGEMGLRAGEPGVFLMDSDKDISNILDLAHKHVDSVASIARFREENSWVSRFQHIEW